MIICDQCSTPIPREEHREVGIPSRADPFGEEHWCAECATAYGEFYTVAKRKFMALINQEVDEKMAIFLGRKHQ